MKILLGMMVFFLAALVGFILRRDQLSRRHASEFFAYKKRVLTIFKQRGSR